MRVLAWTCVWCSYAMILADWVRVNSARAEIQRLGCLDPIAYGQYMVCMELMQIETAYAKVTVVFFAGLAISIAYLMFEDKRATTVTHSVTHTTVVRTAVVRGTPPQHRTEAV